MMGKKPKKTASSFGLGNLTLFGFNLNELVKNAGGHSLEELANDPELAQEVKGRLRKERPEALKRPGDTSVSYRITRRQETKASPSRQIAQEMEEQLKAKEERDRAWEEEEEKRFGAKVKGKR